MNLLVISPGTAVSDVPDLIGTDNQIVHVGVGVTDSKYKQDVADIHKYNEGVVLDYLYIFYERKQSLTDINKLILQVAQLDTEVSGLKDKLKAAGIEPKEV